jgi:hypothetical protein
VFASRSHIRHTLLTLLIVLLGAARVQATPIFEPNNRPTQATILNAGQLTVADSLNGNSGRPNTLLASSDPAFREILAVDDNSSPLGNGFASKLTGVPLQPNGSAYFRVTGAPDATFTGNQTQSGSYSVRFDLYDAQHNFFETLPLDFEGVSPGMFDFIWFNPPKVTEPQRVGGTVDVTINNVVGPGTGDSLDYFWFSGLRPGQQFTARLTADFGALIGLYSGVNNLVAVSHPGDAAPTLIGNADAQGRILIGVSGGNDTGFKGEHVDAGQYLLTVIPAVTVPEPSSVVLLALGGTLAMLGPGLRRSFCFDIIRRLLRLRHHRLRAQ